MSTRPVLAALALVLSSTGLAACTDDGSATDAAARGAPGGPAEILSLRTTGGAVTVDVRSGRVLVSAPEAVAQADWSALFRTEAESGGGSGGGGGTTLRALDPATGAETSSVRLPGSLAIRAVAGDGSQVALTRPQPSGVDAWTPVPRRNTTIVVADPSGDTDPETFRLEGNLEPEAFSTDGEYLFVIQYLPPTAPALYRVSALELEDGDVYPVLARPKTWSQRMPGTRLAQLHAPDGRQLYTLYSSQPAAYADGYDLAQYSAERPVAFVHVLNLEDEWAYCLPLPKRLWDAPAGQQAMAASPDGARLYVVDPSRDTVAVIGARRTKVVETATVAFDTADTSHAAAAVSPDGATLYVATGEAVVALDADTLEVRFRWPTPSPVEALATSADGATIYAAFADRIEVLDPASGAVRGAIPLDGVQTIARVAPAA